MRITVEVDRDRRHVVNMNRERGRVIAGSLGTDPTSVGRNIVETKTRQSHRNREIVDPCKSQLHRGDNKGLSEYTRPKVKPGGTVHVFFFGIF